MASALPAASLQRAAVDARIDGDMGMEPKEGKTVCACSCASSCCGGSAAIPGAPYIVGWQETPVGAVPRVATELSARDLFGAWRVRWGIGRMSYKVVPGLYCVGEPHADSPVLVTANYKLTFDSLRKELNGLNLWILVLDTKGVNVWCAAGKGTFGTDELVYRVKAAGVGEVVRHRTLILPQLGATGVAAHEAAGKSGFHVRYGPVRACDIRAFLANGLRATPEMRTVRFTMADRAVLTPVDLVQWMKPLAASFGVLFILNALGLGRFGLPELAALFGAVAVGCVLTPILLPWIPGRAFAFKGVLLGLVWAAAIVLLAGGPPGISALETAAFLLLLPAVSAYTAMQFTGSSTYTSPSGVNREMRVALPMMLFAVVSGAALLVVSGLMKTVL